MTVFVRLTVFVRKVQKVHELKEELYAVIKTKCYTLSWPLISSLRKIKSYVVFMTIVSCKYYIIFVVYLRRGIT